jgi:hypothetical protein
MGSAAGTQTAPRARAVAGAPVDALLVRCDELARRWAIGLILALPLERVAEIPLERFARDAPLLCAGVVRALRSDEELDRICSPSGGPEGASAPARRLAEVTGARGAKGAVEALEALRGVLWDALVDEMGRNGTDRVQARELAELADRLAYVCSRALACSLDRMPEQAPEQTPSRPIVTLRAAADDEPPAGADSSRRSALGGGVVIIDEGHPAVVLAGDSRVRASPRAAGALADASPPASARPGRRQPRARPLPWDTPPA